MRQLAVCLDFDDTCVDFLGALLDTYYLDSGDLIPLNSLTDYKLPNPLKSHLKASERLGFYRSLQSLRGSFAFIDKCQKLGIKIIFITARPEKYEEDTRHNLREHSIQNYELYFSKDKAKTIESLKTEYNILAFIDDRASTVVDVHTKCNLPYSFLVNKPHNKNCFLDGLKIIRIDDLADAWVILSGSIQLLGLNIANGID
jgi:hypothetical protein